MTDKKVLGKGLAALISENSLIVKDGDESVPYLEIDIEKIEPNPFQPRKIFTDHDLNELKNSIRQHGVLQPIVLRKYKDKYQIVAGERRYRASKMLGNKSIIAVIRDLNDRDVFEIALIENIQRQNLTAVEEAESFEKLINEFNHTHESLSNIIGKSRSYITNTLRLTKLPAEVKRLILERKISAGHARALVNNVDAVELANKIANDGWSVRQVEQELKNKKYNNANNSKERYKNLSTESAYENSQKDTGLLEIEEMLSKELNTRVKINDYLGGGQIIIEFGTLEQLDLLLEKFGV